MTRLRKITLGDVLGDLPDVEALASTKHDSEPDDLLLCSLGFESRSLSIPQLFARTAYRCLRAGFIRYDRNQADNEVNLPALQECLLAVSNSIEALDAVLPELGNRLRQLVDGIVVANGTRLPRVTLDISVMSNWVVIVCIKVLLEARVHLRLVYSEAEIYHPTKDEFDANSEGWKQDDAIALERGVLAVTVSPEHQGHHLDPLPDSVIVFPSFRKERSRAVITFVDPAISLDHGNRVVWLLGVPHLEADRWRLNAMRWINDLDKEHVPQFEVSTFDYKETVARLETIYLDRWQDYRLTVAPLGSKLQALGTAFFSFLHPDVRLVFAIPHEYNASNYSGGHKALWQIKFGSLECLRQTLGAVGSLVIEKD
jgi:hypothetical protein